MYNARSTEARKPPSTCPSDPSPLVIQLIMTSPLPKFLAYLKSTPHTMSLNCMLNLTHSYLNMVSPNRRPIPWEIGYISLHSPQNSAGVTLNELQSTIPGWSQWEGTLWPQPCKMEMAYFMPGKSPVQQGCRVLWCRLMLFSLPDIEQGSKQKHMISNGRELRISSP